jgi:hypothetical protein
VIRPILVAAAIAGASAIEATAQTPEGRVEVSVGVIRVGEVSLGTADAKLSTASGGTTSLFETSSAIEGVAGINLRVNMRAWKRIEAEAFASIARPTLATAISNDLEATETVNASEPIEQYVVGGGALWYLPVRFSGPRFMPFVAGGIAYLRELHEENTLVQTGTVYELGAGAKYWFLSRTAARLKGLGVRGDARISARSKGVAFDDGLRYGPALSAALVARF